MSRVFVFLLLVSGCAMNEKNEKLSVDIKEVEGNELEKVYPLIIQLNPKMSKQEFQKNYDQVQEYKLYQAIIPQNGASIGLIGYVFNRDLCVGRAMYVDVLVVEKKYRNKGVATQLMNFAVSKLHQDKTAHCLRWTTRTDLKEAVNFYKNKIKEPLGYYYRIDNPYFSE